MNIRTRRVALIGILSLFTVAVAPNLSQAIPILQLYAEGATYDSSTASWVYTGSGPFTLWVIGNETAPGGKGQIIDVSIVAAFPSAETGYISITPTTTSLVADPSVPSNPAYVKTVTDGSLPVMSDGKTIPDHGAYGTGINWNQYSIGNFALLDSPVADLINTFPSSASWYPNSGQINAYTVTISGYNTVHFDAFDHVASSSASKFAPPSHDVTAVPEPATYILLGSGLIALARWGKNKLPK